MAEGQIKIVFEPTPDGLYKAVSIEDAQGNVVEGWWQDTRPWRKEHGVRVIWADESDASHADLHRIMVGDQDVSKALEQ